MGMKEALAPNNTCPFCGNTRLERNEFLKPWGFAPRNGTAFECAKMPRKDSFAEPPSYSATPNKPLTQSTYDRISYSNMRDCSLIVANRGPNQSGFDICKKCGAAYPSVLRDELRRKIKPPYKRDYKNALADCSHSFVNGVVLGDVFNTDLVLFAMEINPNEVCTLYENPWLKRSSTSLAEAFRLAAVDYLDIDFAELCVGSRIRYGKTRCFVDIFLYDSLSSGAGYSTMLGNDRALQEILERVRHILEDCTCESACLECLKHYQNKVVHSLLDRHAALDLLDYVTNGTVRNTTHVANEPLFAPLIEAIRLEGDISCSLGKRSLRVTTNRNGVTIKAIPDILNKTKEPDSLVFWERELRHSLPSVFNCLKNKLA